MSITLPPLPKPAHGFYAAPMYSPDQLRARDREVARLVLEGAANVATENREPWTAQIIRALEVSHE